jgi:hypothetical protein
METACQIAVMIWVLLCSIPRNSMLLYEKVPSQLLATAFSTNHNTWQLPNLPEELCSMFVSCPAGY